MRIVKDSLKSRCLLKRVNYQILFPHDSNVRENREDRPVLYLLHGLFGEAENWTDFTEIADWFENLSFAVVAFDAENSWYTDGIKGRKAGYENFFLKEFIPCIENVYKLGGDRKNRALAGLSMGGYGALKIALKYPSLFVWAGSMSGAFDAPRQTDERPGPDWEILGDSIKAVFGENRHNDLRAKNDLFRIISEIKSGDLAGLPNIYFDCGRDDSFIEVNRELFEKFEKNNISCCFCEEPGGHDWSYWNRQLKKILQLAEQNF